MDIESFSGHILSNIALTLDVGLYIARMYAQYHLIV